MAVVRWRQSLNGVHTWLGLLCGWWLFFMFVTGTLGYLDVQLDHWLQPKLVSQRSLPAEQMLPEVERHLQQQSAQQWRVQLPVGQQRPFYEVDWRAEERQSAILQAIDGDWQWLPTPQWGGQWLYQLHYRFHYLGRDVARTLACILSAWLLLVLISGIVVHKKILQEMLLLRSDKGLRSWLDGHNLLAVTALPFYLVMAYSGLLFYGSSVWPGTVAAGFDFAEDARSQYFAGVRQPVPESTELLPAEGISLLQLYQQARQHWGRHGVSDIRLDWSTGMARLSGPDEGIVRGGSLAYVDLSTGEWLPQEVGMPWGQTLQQALFGLHEGLFAAPWLRFLYVLAGVLGCILIASGHVIWLRKRERRRDRWWYLVRVLNLASFAGLPAAIACFLLLLRGAEVSLHIAQDGLFVAWLLLTVAAVRCPPASLYGLAALAWWMVALIDWWQAPWSCWQALVRLDGDWLAVQLLAWLAALALSVIAWQHRRQSVKGDQSCLA
ncbi:membrane protein [Bacterioplanes sanyensis]|uniref:PepSY-associated TM helix domain-containing protein n=1 Tax=Bacterioplanes sanyensis TaxID=1249553 RepID=UPI0016790A31|nr:PepSY-associated TM helix domain-containing protein [Bacterioplanes sanyensis]GGY33001.1 membrane protein [Bacterioplanes sanyensis]